MNTITDTKDYAIALHTPIDVLFGKYHVELNDLKHISDFIENKHQTLTYFKDALSIENKSYFNTQEFFNFDAAKRALDAYYWKQVMALTDILEVMPAEKRNQWNEMMRQHKIVTIVNNKKEIAYIPSFEKDIVLSTIGDMLYKRELFLAERVDGIFRNLSHDHVTNVPEGFSKRMIINYMFSYNSISNDRSNYIHDLRCVIAKFMGRDTPKGNETYQALCRIHDGGRHGQWHVFDGGAWKIRLYKKGTAHVEVHPDMAYRLNMMLAMLYPSAIPAKFKTKQPKPQKEHELHTNTLPFRVINELGDLRFDRYGKIATTYQKLSKDTLDILIMLGCTTTASPYKFDYDVVYVINDLMNSGMIPDHISHQFYPTPPELAQIVVNMAEIKESDKCLEPSAGMGGIADLMPYTTDCVEICKLHVNVLQSKGYNVVGDDFLAYTPDTSYNVVCMNPPFSVGRAVAHLKHATGMLEADGRVVCILPASNKNKQLVDGFKHEYSEIYSNLFQGTSVSVVILKLTKII